MVTNTLFKEVMKLHCGIRALRDNELYYWFDAMGEIREHNINFDEFIAKCEQWLQDLEDFSIEYSTNAFQKKSVKLRFHGKHATSYHSLPFSTKHQVVLEACETLRSGISH